MDLFLLYHACMQNKHAYMQNNTQAEGRRVDLFLLYDASDKLENIIIADNGKGMDESGRQQYATFSYSKDSRVEDGVIDLVCMYVFIVYSVCTNSTRL